MIGQACVCFDCWCLLLIKHRFRFKHETLCLVKKTQFQWVAVKKKQYCLLLSNLKRSELLYECYDQALRNRIAALNELIQLYASKLLFDWQESHQNFPSKLDSILLRC